MVIHRKHNALTRSQVKRLCDLPGNDPNDPVAVRDRCLLLLLSETGLRLSEIAAIGSLDLHHIDNRYSVGIASGQREVAVSERTYSALLDWLFVRPVQGPALFMRTNKVGSDHGLWWEDPLSKAFIGATLTRYGALIGIDHLTTFDLRCYAARQISRKSVRLAMQTLGHIDPLSTARMQVADDVIDTNSLY